MKYKVGDKVRVKENLPLYMKAHCVSTFSPETLKYNGMIVTVSEVKKDQYKIEEDNGFYDWYEDMLEPVEEMSAEEATKILGKICCESEVCAECPISEAKGKMPCQNFRRDKAGEVLEILKQWKADHEKKEVEVEFAWYAVIKDEKGSIVHEMMLLTDNYDTRKLFESCEMKAKTVVNPIIDWKDEDIWNFIHIEKVPVCELYGCGYERLGCLGCPLARKSQREREMHDYPKYKQAYIHAFDRMLEMRRLKGKKTQWTCGEEVYHWWMQDTNVFGQMQLSDFMEV